MMLGQAPQHTRKRHCAPQGGEITPEDLASPLRPRAVEQTKRGCPSGLVRGEVDKRVAGGGARVNDLDRVRERMRIEHRAEEGDLISSAAG